MVGSSNWVGSLPNARSYSGAVDGGSACDASESDGEAAVSIRSIEGLPGEMIGDGGAGAPVSRVSYNLTR